VINRVPACVPSVVHNPNPWAESVAVKKSCPPTKVRFPGLELMGPGMTSRAIAVPPGVPSVFQISLPETPSSATKNAPVPAGVTSWMEPIVAPGGGENDASWTVPATVPSLRVRTYAPAFAIVTTYAYWGEPVIERSCDPTRLNNMVVPVAVPSVAHNP
jgi:hypothetical protein